MCVLCVYDVCVNCNVYACMCYMYVIHVMCMCCNVYTCVLLHHSHRIPLGQGLTSLKLDRWPAINPRNASLSISTVPGLQVRVWFSHLPFYVVLGIQAQVLLLAQNVSYLLSYLSWFLHSLHNVLFVCDTGKLSLYKGHGVVGHACQAIYDMRYRATIVLRILFSVACLVLNIYVTEHEQVPFAARTSPLFSS